jgi:hypothetical protein
MGRTITQGWTFRPPEAPTIRPEPDVLSALRDAWDATTLYWVKIHPGSVPSEWGNYRREDVHITWSSDVALALREYTSWCIRVHFSTMDHAYAWPECHTEKNMAALRELCVMASHSDSPIFSAKRTPVLLTGHTCRGDAWDRMMHELERRMVALRNGA